MHFHPPSHDGLANILIINGSASTEFIRLRAESISPGSRPSTYHLRKIVKVYYLEDHGHKNWADHSPAPMA
jgi:hypothetical protein